MVRFLLVLFLLISSHATAGVDPALQQAIDLTYNAQFSEAENILKAYTNAHPEDPLGYLIRGTSMDWKKKIYDEDAKVDERIVEEYKMANKLAYLQWEKDPENVDALINLGNSYMFLAKKWIDMDKKMRAGLTLKKCKKHMWDAIKKDPMRYDAYVALGIFNFYAGNLPSGLKFFASLLGISGDEATGLDQLRLAATQPNILQADALFVISHAYGKTKKNYPQAKKYLDLLVTKYPNNPYFRFLKGEAAFFGKKFPETRENLKDFFAFCEGHATLCAQVYHYYGNYYLAASYILEKNYLPAKPYVKKMEELYRAYNNELAVGTHYYKGLIAKAEGKREEAIREFRFVEAHKTENMAAWELSEKELEGL